MLDTTSVRIAMAVVASSMLVLFYTDIYRRTRAPFCGWWCASLALLLAASAAFVVAGTSGQPMAGPVGIPVGNVLAAAAGGAAWAAARSLNGPAPAWWQLTLGPAVVAVASAVDSPQTNEWAGGVVYLATMALLMGLAARELWRVGSCVSVAAYAMAVAAGAYSVYSTARAVAFVTLGPESEVFEAVFGSGIATLVMLMMLVATTAGMSSLSSEQQAAELTVAATTDGLTGLLNRREFLRRAAVVLREARDGHADAAVMIADLDHFKQLNDRFGHRAGDRALQAFAAACAAVLRPDDTVARLGGEEFGFLLPGTSESEAQRLADEIARRVREWGEELGWGLTVSFGIAVLDGETGLEQGMEHADVALYQAKRAGRDRSIRYRGA